MITLERFRKKNKAAIPVVDNRFTSVQFPPHGDPNLSSFITGNYSLNDDNYLAECVRREEEQLEALIQTSDGFTVGETFDSHIDSQILREESRFQEEVALQEVQGTRIVNECEVRKEEIDRELPPIESKIHKLEEDIAPLEGKHAHFTLPLGTLRIPMAPIITILALIVDMIVNYSFLQDVLLMGGGFLLITVALLAVFSDGTMFMFGTLYSQRGKTFLSNRLYYAFLGGLLFFFLVSIVSTILIRFGSMPTTFATVDSSGAAVVKESFSLADYGVTIITSFATACTGLLCLVVSADQDAPVEKRRRRLESERDALLRRRSELLAERQALELAVDPRIRDKENRKAAQKNLDALRLTLKLHARALLALHQQDAAYTDDMSKSSQELLDNSRSTEAQPTDNATADNNKHEPNLKEVV